MPIQIHGKSYNTVAERITAAGKDLLEVNTEVLYQQPVVIKATIKTTKGIFTGISAANPNKSIEKESPYEVAESSAVGRALAFAGYETTNGIASAEEMRKVDFSKEDQLIQEPEYDAADNALCQVHVNDDGSAIKMNHYSNAKGEWWSHKLSDGSWCNGRKTKYNGAN